MSTFTRPTEEPPLQYFSFWRCNICGKTSTTSWEGYWDGRKAANRSLRRHKEKKHGGRIWKNKTITFADLEKPRKEISKKRNKK